MNVNANQYKKKFLFNLILAFQHNSLTLNIKANCLCLDLKNIY